MQTAIPVLALTNYLMHSVVCSRDFTCKLLEAADVTGEWPETCYAYQRA